jgi:myo-inositol-1(or 4)-monophosphatase
MEQAFQRFEDLRRPGAAALDLAWTASGTFDGFFELGLNTWDVAAGAALVLEVGGRVTDWAGGDTWIESGDILAGAPAVHEVLLELAAQSPDR